MDEKWMGLLGHVDALHIAVNALRSEVDKLQNEVAELRRLVEENNETKVHNLADGL